MPELNLVAVAVIAVLNVMLFYFVIRTAVGSGTETPKQLKHAWAQTELLIAMARKQGVDDATIKGITEHLQG